MATKSSAMEGMEIMTNNDFWKEKKIFLTGHTGFKGSWLSLWLYSLGAKVTGYALEPPTRPSLFELCHNEEIIQSIIGDIRDKCTLREAMLKAQPDIVIHMAAQPLVRDSYKIPAETFEINVMGTVNLFEAVRHCKSVKAVVNVTTDKCYENKEWLWGYRENEPMGGHDPYSSSKACSELVTSSYRNSFFHPNRYAEHGMAIASARAGNVIGGGDWATDRLIPDCIKSLLKGRNFSIRSPYATRPWQHVLEPLSGYLLLSQKLYEDGINYAEAWNFGPNDNDARPVEWIVRKLCEKWDGNVTFEVDKSPQVHEANYLKLDCSKAKSLLKWEPHWDIETALDKVVEWYLFYRDNQNMRKICLQQILDFMEQKIIFGEDLL